MQRSKLSLFSFGILPQRMLMDENLANTDLSFKRQNKKKYQGNKGNVQLCHHRAPMPLCNTAAHKW